MDIFFPLFSLSWVRPLISNTKLCNMVCLIILVVYKETEDFMGKKKKKTGEGVDGCEKLVINIVVTALIKLFSNFSTQKRTQFICLKSIAHFTVSHVPARRQCHYLFCSLSFHCTCSPKVESVIFSPLFKESESEKEKEGGRVNNNSSFINGWIWLSGDSFSNAVSQLSQ